MAVSKNGLNEKSLFRHSHLHMQAGDIVKVSGSSKHIHIKNASDNTNCTIPAGLVGKCVACTSASASITFSKTDPANVHLWDHIAGLSAEVKRSGAFTGLLNASQLQAAEILKSNEHHFHGARAAVLGNRG
jgi:hypothetical protein